MKDLGTDGMIISEWIFGKQGGRVWTGCIWLQDRDQWQALVNMIMNSGFHKRHGIS
jgi:hypothetical protein